MMARRTGPRLYGRLVGHGGLRPQERARMEGLYPTLALEEDGPALKAIDIFKDGRPLWLEIGFGAGEHLVWQAQQNPQVGIVGVEPFLTGVAKCLGGIEEAALTNVRLCAGDARRLLSRFPDQSLSRVFILHPDPWPKWRHSKRRLVQPDFLDMLARLMVPGAQLRIGTDWPDYSLWSLQHLLDHPSFEWLARRAKDWQDRPDDWPETRYAQKAKRQGRVDVHLTFERKDTP